MSVYSKVDSGVKLYRSRFNKSYSNQTTGTFGELIPIMARFCLPGDIWRCGARLLVRYQPTLAPVLNRAMAKMRYFFVPLRLLYPDICEKVITGSFDGKEVVGSLPVFPDFLNGITSGRPCSVRKGSFWDYLGIQKDIDFSSLNDPDKSFFPAEYWYKAFMRIYWDYFRDENFQEDDDFESFFNNQQRLGLCFDVLPSVRLRKDYFTSSLPWQMKGPTPTFTVQQSIDFNGSFTTSSGSAVLGQGLGVFHGVTNSLQTGTIGAVSNEGFANDEIRYSSSSDLKDALDKIKISGASFDVADLRAIFAQTRVFERLARCGSRYTEYLRANFNTSPSDGTLQRAVYLGGFSQPIVTTEIAQTAADGDNAVGTLRGKGISDSGGFASPYFVKEFGVIFGLLTVMPEINYTQGIDREYTYKERFDFFNPSFQNLSEQEVRNAEIFVAKDNKNSETFGFQGYFNELRSSRNIISGDLVDTLSYWTQAISFTSRPNLNDSLLAAYTYDNATGFRRPFAVRTEKPLIIDCRNLLDVYRPMVRNPVPGLIDHN
nr:major capsid protein [Rattus norvegicus microvirus]